MILKFAKSGLDRYLELQAIEMSGPIYLAHPVDYAHFWLTDTRTHIRHEAINSLCMISPPEMLPTVTIAFLYKLNYT